MDGLRVFHSGTSLTHYDRDGVPEWRLGVSGEALAFPEAILAEIRSDYFGQAFDRAIRARVERGEARDGAFFGDSILAQLNGLVHPENSATWFSLIGGHAVVNAAIAGDRIRHNLGRLWAIEPTAKLIALQIGTNDHHPNFPNADPIETAEGIARFVAEAQRLAPNAVILLVAIPPTTDDIWSPKNQVTNELIAKIADGDRVRFTDPSSLSLVDMSDPSHTPDGVHFLPPAAALWYGALTPIFAEILSE
ncbi:MAG: GDSL-type esterase/lipase family protein [Deltaproteobacteria bacterium]